MNESHETQRGIAKLKDSAPQCNQVGKAPQDREEPIESKPGSSSAHQIHLHNQELGDIIDVSSIQSLLEVFYKLTGMAVAILDLKGKTLIAIGWQDICTQFHRVHPQTAANCTESDLYLAKKMREGEYVAYKCKNQMWDVVTPLHIAGTHMGNVYTGQFFYEDETVDVEVFARQAAQYGFDRESYLDALRRVPRLSRDRVKDAMDFLTQFSAMVSELSFSNMKLAQAISEQQRITLSLQESEERFRLLFEDAQEGVFQSTPEGQIIIANAALARMLRYDSPQELASAMSDIGSQIYVHPEERKALIGQVMREGGVAGYEVTLRRADGEQIKVIMNLRLVPDKEGEFAYIEGSCIDITARWRAETLLREREQQLSLIIDSFPGCVSHIGRDFRFTFINDQHALVSLEPLKSAVGLTVAEVFGEGLSQIWQPYMKRALNGEMVAFESCVKKDSGETIYGQTTFTPDFDSDKTVKGFFVFVDDITESRRLERSLIENETRLHSLIQTIPDLVWLKDTAGVFLSCNKKFEHLFGAKEADIIGKTDYDFVDRELADYFRDHDRKAMAACQSCSNLEWLTFAEDGYRGLFETIKTPMCDADGKLIGVLGVARDITERKWVENSLKEANTRLENIIEFLPDATLIADSNKRVIAWNRAIEEMTGVPKTDMLGKTLLEAMVPFYGEPRPCLMDFLDKNDEEILSKYAHIRRKGHALYAETFAQALYKGKGAYLWGVASPLFDSDGNAIGAIESIRDITERKQAEEALLWSEEKLRQSQKLEAMGTLAGGIAHDFNNILGAILGYAELTLLDAHDVKQVSANQEQILIAGKRARDLVRQILAFSRKLEQDRKPILLQTLIEEAYSLFRATLPSTIDIRLKIDPACGPVLADPSQMHQVAINLVTNAYHAMRATGGKLDIQLHPQEVSSFMASFHPELQPGKHVCLRVSDTGAGIDAEIMKRIFDPYFTTKKVGEGSGLGLAVVHGIVQGHKGTILVESRVGIGTTFQILLPCCKQAAESAAKDSSGEIMGGSGHILFVDDEEEIVKPSKKILEKLGYTVTAKTSSLEALSVFQASPWAFDLVITDQTMPQMTGMALIKELRKIRPGVPIILCTGYSDEVSPEQVKQQGLLGNFYKPVDLKDLAQAVQKTLPHP